LFQGSGLSEVRSLLAWSRPGFSFTTDSNSVQHRQDIDQFGSGIQAVAFSALLTNKTTLQTVSLGEQALGETSIVAAAFVSIPFPANHNALKFRFICPQVDPINPRGKFTLQFCNFEVPPFYQNVPSFLSLTSST
jgi:hypothetical protein